MTGDIYLNRTSTYKVLSFRFRFLISFDSDTFGYILVHHNDIVYIQYIGYIYMKYIFLKFFFLILLDLILNSKGLFAPRTITITITKTITF